MSSLCPARHWCLWMEQDHWTIVPGQDRGWGLSDMKLGLRRLDQGCTRQNC